MNQEIAMDNNVLGGKKLVAFVVTTACLFAIASMAAKSISEQTTQNNVPGHTQSINVSFNTAFLSAKQ